MAKGKKYWKWWKDKDFVILTTKEIDQERFFKEMSTISQKMFGTPNPDEYGGFFIPIGKKRREHDADKSAGG